ncbi:MAG: NAD(P)H-quinone oxidoreductase [Spirochaetia bacterium]|nr:NAD(P)H-quinone oxidoreductase [Spirochaetia bacterium]
MHAMLVNEGKDLVWSEVPAPVLKAGEVLIEVHAAALNRADLMQRAGEYPSPPGWPDWMGLEVAGLILQSPSGSRFRTGDKVCALLGGGGYAEQVAVPENMVLPVPDGLTLAEAAAIPEAFATSYLNLLIEGGMKAGDTVLIQAGASGLGMAAIQLAKHMGAKVMTTVGSEEKAAFVRTLGADIIVNRKTDDLADVMDRHPVDIAMDPVAGVGMGACVERMAPGGRWIVIATLAGAKTEIDMNRFFRKGLKLIGSTLRSRSSAMKAEILSALEKTLWARFSSGEIKSVVYKTFPMAKAEEAHAILERQENLGKVVLTMG